MENPWLVGRECIVDYFYEKWGLSSWQTVRAWIKKYGFPIRHLPSGKPYFIESEALKWLEKQNF